MANTTVFKDQLDTFIHNVPSDSRSAFLAWIKDKIDSGDWGECKAVKSSEDVIMENIQADLRAELPPTAVTNTENITFPRVGKNADCDPNTTIHVDEFLYDEDAVDELCDEGKLSRNYCVDCGSHQVKPLTFITHSASLAQIKYIYQHLLEDLRGRQVLDIGSRTGAMLYGAHLYSGASRIFGVEIDQTFCKLQTAVVSKYNMADRIQVIHDDIQNHSSVISSSDVVILNNVFEFFASPELQQRLWQFVLSSVKRDTILVTMPSLEESLEHLQCGIALSQCVEPISTEDSLQQCGCELLSSANTEESGLENIFLYRVKAPYTVHSPNK